MTHERFQHQNEPTPEQALARLSGQEITAYKQIFPEKEQKTEHPTDHVWHFQVPGVSTPFVLARVETPEVDRLIDENTFIFIETTEGGSTAKKDEINGVIHPAAQSQPIALQEASAAGRVYKIE